MNTPIKQPYVYGTYNKTKQFKALDPLNNIDHYLYTEGTPSTPASSKTERI